MAFSEERSGTLVVTRWELLEVANALGSTPIRERAAEMVQQIEWHPGFRVVRESDRIYERGLVMYAKRPDKAWSLTDYISFVVMDQEGIREALTGDRHFAQAGFLPLFAA